MPLDEFVAALPEAFAVVSAGWRYGDVLGRCTEPRAILTVSGGWPPELDYARCFARGIRVLSAAPAFAEAVAEMALALALASSRDVVAEDRAMRAGKERWLSSADTLGTFLFSPASESASSASGTSGGAYVSCSNRSGASSVRMTRG